MARTACPPVATIKRLVPAMSPTIFPVNLREPAAPTGVAAGTANEPETATMTAAMSARDSPRRSLLTGESSARSSSTCGQGVTVAYELDQFNDVALGIAAVTGT